MWKEDEIKPITAIAAENDELKAYYKKRNTSDNFTEIDGVFEYKGDRVHELLTSFKEDSETSEELLESTEAPLEPLETNGLKVFVTSSYKCINLSNCS